MTDEDLKLRAEIFFGRLNQLDLCGQTKDFKEKIDKESRGEACERYIFEEFQRLIEEERQRLTQAAQIAAEEAIKVAVDLATKAERERVKKFLEMCRFVYEREANRERQQAQDTGLRPRKIGDEVILVYHSPAEKMLADKATACEYAIWIVCDWSVGTDYKPNWMPLPY